MSYLEECENLLKIFERINYAISNVDLNMMQFTVSEIKYHSNYNYRLDKNAKSFEKEIIKFINPDYFGFINKSEYNGYRSYKYKIKTLYYRIFLDFFSR